MAGSFQASALVLMSLKSVPARLSSLGSDILRCFDIDDDDEDEGEGEDEDGDGMMKLMNECETCVEGMAVKA